MIYSIPSKEMYLPIVSTDSEIDFCWILDRIRAKFPEPPRYQKELFDFLRKLCDQLSEYGVFNMLPKIGVSPFSKT
jgi:glutamine amidotransferase